jgi:ribonuclease P protein component
VLPAGSRLRRRADFATALRRGRRARAADLLLVHAAADPVAAGGSAGPARVGFAVPRAVGSAVTRNRVRRRLRHLVTALLPGLPPGALVVVRALPGSAAASSAELEPALRSALDRALAPSSAVGSRP